jgi:thiol-disulfide isomerase/thioredoxin
MNQVRKISLAALLVLSTTAGCQNEANSPEVPISAASGSTELPHGRLPFITGFETGLAAARQQGKPMLVFFTAEWCHYCHAMAVDALSQEAVVRIADRFVCVLVDADAEPEVCRQFRVRAYPTLQFLSPTGVPLNRMTGKQPGQQVVMEMQAALQAVARRPGEGTRSL